MALIDNPRIVTACKPRPARPAKPEPVARIVHSPSAKTRAAIARWERLTGQGSANGN
jgi:hypothetical protein